eukprot:CAMPEP_0185767008 /NCGR_PEP_ID=MMETSP1174-20130828/40851_1 /TAXON_ID=35687 /ORGANISM="Dictyocha speculum, Strain CCMP1381" /LENGTH=506 /DNA_ID=CAMNT_0028450977 /DNA_START=110 /DNA_END=1630 /DNA_ORIENTATION=+
MTRIRIEGLLAAFPKLMGTGSQQHTFLETDSVRYVYQPIETLYLLVITNKASNIVEDLETLRLLSKLVPEIAEGVTEEKILDKMFELVFAFDEVLTPGGHRESITMPQIQVNLSMESHEEKLHKMIEESKVSSTKEEADRRAKTIKEQQRSSKAGGMSSGGMAGMGGGGDSMAESVPETDYTTRPFSELSSGQQTSTSSEWGYSQSPKADPEPVTAKKGMKLGGSSKKQQIMDKFVSEDNLAPLSAKGNDTSGKAMTPATAAAPVATHPVSLLLEEKVAVTMNREGALELMEIKGTMALVANGDEFSKCKVILAGAKNPLFTYQTHPKVDKKAYEKENILCLKDKNKGFPKGKLGILRWSMNTQDDSQVPISINCWPEDEDGNMNVNVEFNAEGDMELHNVQISIPLGTSNPPEIVSMDTGSHKHNRTNEVLIWDIELIDGQNKTSSLEFNVAQDDADAFFPISVSFGSTHLKAGLDVANILSSENDAPIQFGLAKMLVTDSYQVV